jgi:hypothetical protein
MRIVGDQAGRVRGEATVDGNVLKVLDEYNYCRFSKG